MTQEIEHSPLGASGAYRWMNCGGSVELAKQMEGCDDYEIEPSYRAEGTAAHHMATYLIENNMDAWALPEDGVFNGILVTRIERPAVQSYVDFCRSITDHTDTVFNEHTIGEKFEDRPHPSFFGTVDYAAFNAERIHIVDFKYGAGIAISPKDNPQCMYYAYGILLDIERNRDTQGSFDFPIKITIVQPRTFEKENVKTWETTAGYIYDWARDELLPKMRDPGVAYVAGEHCRFCPAKIACPLLKGMFAVAAKINKDWVKSANPVGLGQEYVQIAPVKMYIKAIEAEVYNRLMAGVEVPETKLVQQKANRVWKEGALEVILKDFGKLAMTEPELKSPAEVEKLGTDAKKTVSEWAFVPNTGYTVALASDSKAGIKMKTSEETFASFVKAE